jgi:N-acetylglucosamine-6-phosphate deacetylase
MPIITARHLITDIGTIDYPVITTDATGLITDISSDPKALANETDTLTAAFLDIHTHGAVGHDVMQSSPKDLSKIQRFLAQHGVAHYLPTTVTAPIDTTLRALEALANAIEAAPSDHEQVDPANIGARPIGIHLEGPFLSHAKRGVHPPAELQPPSIDLFNRFQTAARGHIKLLTIAPEPNAAHAATNPGTGTSAGAPGPSHLGTWAFTEPKSSAIDLIAHATQQGVRMSLGHSNATAAETLPAIEAGAASATHTFNAMRALDHREPGILGTVLDDDRLYAELICDGVHVAPPLVRLWLKAKGPERAILVTDSMSAAGMPDGNYSLGAFTVTVKEGVAWLIEGDRSSLAGSLLTLDRAVSNLQAFTKAPLAEATRLASHNPAAMLGQPNLTRITLGTPANLNRFNSQNQLIATYIRGQQIPL